MKNLHNRKQNINTIFAEGDAVLAGNRSFKAYVAERFENEMYAAIEGYTSENYNKLDLRLNKVRNIGGIELSNIDLKFVSVNDLPGMKIEFDVVVEAELEVRESDYHYDESENCSQWFALKCYGDLDFNLDDFRIASIELFSSKSSQSKPMSDSLVPIIYKEQLEAVATDFLQRNNPEVLEKPEAVQPRILAKKMGLDVKIMSITKDASVFGQIYFHDCKTDLYDKSTNELVNTLVKGRTILVDPKIFFQRNLGAVNNTIIHECVHWDLHRKAFELERLYNNSAARIKCQVVGGLKENINEATDWMEWQANSLTPKIQMPIDMFKLKASEFIRTFSKRLDTVNIINVIEPVIDALSTFFCVSRLAAKIRMIDIGYEEAIGTFIFIDGRYVKPHKFSKGAIKSNQTFSISAVDAAIQSFLNPYLISIGETGCYQYVDSHFVLNHPKYLKYDENDFTVLTNYARNHMDECCLIFDLVIKSGCKERYHSECFLNRDESSNIDFSITFHEGYENAPQERQIELLKRTIAEENRVYGELPNSFVSAVRRVIDWRNDQIKEEKKKNPNRQLDRITAAEIARRTGLHEATVRRAINEGNSSINTTVLICLALHLPYKISKHIIDHSGEPLMITNENHQWYDFALQYHYAKTVDEVRLILDGYGADPL